MGEHLKKISAFSSGLQTFFGAVRLLLLPDRCMVCGTYLAPPPHPEPLSTCFCSVCLSLPLPEFSSPFCPCCGRLFPEGSSRENHLCESCLKPRPDIAKVRAAFSYEGIIRTAVALLKYKGRVRLASPLGQHLFDSFEAHFGDDDMDLILPIPLHISRAWHRQFNQAVLLLRHFPRRFRQRHGKAPAWDIRLDLLSRRRATVSQTGLDQKAREKNLKHAFAVTDPDGVKGKHILLVDDVYTSGATCRAAAGSLLEAGASQVDALVLARA